MGRVFNCAPRSARIMAHTSQCFSFRRYGVEEPVARGNMDDFFLAPSHVLLALFLQLRDDAGSG